MRLRRTARVFVLDANERVLLFKIEDHDLTDSADPDRPTSFWIAPGGGVEEGETFEAAALRELWEETGIRPAEIGPKVLERDILLREDGQDIVFQTTFFLARVEAADISLLGLNPQERAAYQDHRWWSLDELESAGEAFFPEELLIILRAATAV